MTLKDLGLIVGTTNLTAFRSYLIGPLGKLDNGMTYTSEHLNAFVHATLIDPDSKKSAYNNRK